MFNNWQSPGPNPKLSDLNVCFGACFSRKGVERGGGEPGLRGSAIRILWWPQRADGAGASSVLDILTVVVCVEPWICSLSLLPKMHFYFKGESWSGFCSLLGSGGSWLALLPEYTWLRELGGPTARDPSPRTSWVERLVEHFFHSASDGVKLISI